MVTEPANTPLQRYSAVLFDMDGIVTSTTALDAKTRQDGVRAFPGSVRWVKHLRRNGSLTAVVSSSINSAAVLAAAGIDRLFDVSVDGHDIERLGLRGKPAPDTYLEAASRLPVHPRQAVVVEDALAGIAAARAGGFGFVIGVARNADRSELRAAGAHLVVADLGELI